MVTYSVTGSYKKTRRFLKKNTKMDFRFLEKYAQEGVKILSKNTPKDSGNTAGSWGYEIVPSGEGVTIYWTNRNVNKGVPIALILQYGHGTGTGGYVQGRDYINPAIRPTFDRLAEAAWKEVTSS